MKEITIDFKTAFEAMPGYSALLDVDAPKYTIISVTSQYLEPSAKKREDVVGKGIFEAFPINPEDKEHISAKHLDDSFRKVISTKKEHTLPVHRYDLPGENGEYIDYYWQATNVPVLDQKGEVIYIIHTAKDITDKIKAEKQQQTIAGLEHAHSLFMQAPVAIAILKGPELIIELANAPIIHLWGKGQDVLNKSIRQILPELAGQDLFDIMIEVMQTGNPYYGYEQPIQLLRENQAETLYFTLFYQPFYENGEKEPAGIMIFANNVTERVVATQKTKEKEEQFCILADSIPQLAWMTDADGWIFWYNQRWYEYTGTTFEDMQGWGWRKIHHPELIDDMMLRFQKSIASGEPWEDTFLLRGKDGEYRWFLSRALPIRNSENKIVQWFGTNTDISQQRKFEDDLQFAKDQLENTFKNIPAAVYHFDAKGKLMFLNQKGATLMGYDTVDEVLAEDNIYNFREKIDQKFDVLNDFGQKLPVDESATAITFKTGQPAEVTAQFISKESKASFYLLSRSTPIFDSSGELQMVLTTSHDITSQKEAEQAISYRTALLEAHNSASLDGILIVDAKGKIISFNKKFIEIWNMPQSIIDSKNDNAALEFAMSQLKHPQEFIAGVKECYENASAPRIDELEFLDGKIIERQGYPVTSDNGYYYAWSWAFRDVTSQRNYENNIRESEAKYRDLAASLDEKVQERTKTVSQLNETHQFAEQIGKFGSYRYDFETQQLSYSDNLYQLLGCRPQEFKAGPENFMKFIHPEDREYVEKATNDAFVKQETSRWEYRVIRKNGKIIHVRGTGRIFIAEDGKKYMIGTLQDISEEKKQEQQLKENNEALIAMNKELESFAYISSHDLQEPLRKIQTFASRIIDDEFEKISETGKQHFQKIQNAALRMQTLIDDLLVYSRTTTEDRKFEKISLVGIIEEIKEEIREDLEIYQGTIYVGQMSEMKVIPFQFRQLMHNLIGNALKFSRRSERPRIEISSEIVIASAKIDLKLNEGDKYHHITISDNGIGFEPEYGDKIFEVFQRLHGRDKYSGTGIGLAIVKKIVDNHNGIIKATGKPDEGATFDIYIPVL